MVLFTKLPAEKTQTHESGSEVESLNFILLTTNKVDYILTLFILLRLHRKLRELTNLLSKVQILAFAGESHRPWMSDHYHAIAGNRTWAAAAIIFN